MDLREQYKIKTKAVHDPFKSCSETQSRQLLCLRGYRGNGCISAVPSAPSAVREWMCIFIQHVSFSRSAMRFSSMLGLFTSECACLFDAVYSGLVYCSQLIGWVFVKCINFNAICNKYLFTVFWSAHDNNIVHFHYCDISYYWILAHV